MDAGPTPFPELRRAFDVVAIACSLGGPSALRTILSVLPSDFPTPILVVQHRRAGGTSTLASYLGQSCRLHVKEAQHGEPVVAGVVYVAPPGKHLLLSGKRTVTLTDEPRVNFVRPAADRLFESLAQATRERTLAVVLTGCGSDGADGARAVQRAGGTVLVQCHRNAVAPAMPRAAFAQTQTPLVVPLRLIAASLITLVMVRGAAAYFGVSSEAVPRSVAADA